MIIHVEHVEIYIWAIEIDVSVICFLLLLLVHVASYRFELLITAVQEKKYLPRNVITISILSDTSLTHTL